MKEFTPEEINRHDALIDKARALSDGEMMLDEPRELGAPNYFVESKLRRAISYYEQALEINPDGWQSMWAIGKIYQRLGCPEQGFPWFSRAHQVNPQQADVAREAGLAALDLGKSSEALYLCETAVQLAPTDAGLVANLAWAHLISGDVTLAQETIQRAILANPGDAISKRVLAIINEVASGVRPLPKTLREITHPQRPKARTVGEATGSVGPDNLFRRAQPFFGYLSEIWLSFSRLDLKYLYAAASSIFTLFIMTLVVTGNPFAEAPSALGVLEILVVSALVFAGTVAVMTWFSSQNITTEATNFRVSRALKVKALKADFAHYYFELESGGILFLSGDTLNVYGLPEGYSDKDVLFPNKDFSILRDAATETILGLAFHGAGFEAEELVLSDEEAYLAKLAMRNGEVARGMSYDEVKRQLLAS